jgi:glyoxylase-like metal-dependent hydrolase (beta-lactamase superfamily II)
MSDFQVDPINPTGGVYRLKHLMVNSYLIGKPGDGNWVVLDAGMSRACSMRIFRAAEENFGLTARPAAIILTHGHFDHVGALRPMLDRWPVPVFAHEMELPFLSGQANYPRPDLRAGGGFMAWTAFLYPSHGINLGHRVQKLPDDGTVPGLLDWQWIPTPGHSPGHISLFRESDRAVIAGDAFVTVKQESFWAVLTQTRRVHGPPSYFTPDWDNAQRSVERLASLNPHVASTGHGKPMSGDALKRGLDDLLAHFEKLAVPRHVVRLRHRHAH